MCFLDYAEGLTSRIATYLDRPKPDSDSRDSNSGSEETETEAKDSDDIVEAVKELSELLEDCLKERPVKIEKKEKEEQEEEMDSYWKTSSRKTW